MTIAGIDVIYCCGKDRMKQKKFLDLIIQTTNT